MVFPSTDISSEASTRRDEVRKCSECDKERLNKEVDCESQSKLRNILKNILT